MLRVSTAVREIREKYGKEHVILIDDGDLFQGTPVSEEHLLRAEHPEAEPEAMALCLTHIGYDALVLGNHEFNYPWATMRRVYDSLEAAGVRVLAANSYYDGSDGVHGRDENAFGTYLIREVEVNGHIHRVGIFGLENSDITRWDIPANYPGIVFARSDNPAFDQAAEAARYIAQMRAEGCEMIIAAFHGALGDADGPVVFGRNSENQGLRIIRGTGEIDLMILGHDHSIAYSNTFAKDLAGRQVPIVNGGGKDLTETVFRLSEDADGGLVCELVSTRNVDLYYYRPDPALQEKIRPYADRADAALDLPVGTLTGDWDGSGEFYVRQSDTVDLVGAAMMAVGTERMVKKFGEAGQEALRNAGGLDHLEVDAAFSSAVNGGFIPRSGEVSARDVYGMCRYSNNMLVLPMRGRDIRAVLEENASERLTCRVLRGKAYYFAKNDLFTNILLSGVSFRYVMDRPAGERAVIDGFADGRAYEPDALYLVAVNNYILGNERCGLRAWTAEDALWSQLEDDREATVQDIIREYIVGETERAGDVSPEAFNWSWSLVYEGDQAALTAENEAAAVLADAPEDGRCYALYQEAQGCALTSRADGSGGYETTPIASRGDALVDEIPQDTLIITAHVQDGGKVMLSDERGRYLTAGSGGGLSLTDGPADNGLSVWLLIPAEGGYYLKSEAARNNQALEYRDGRIKTYWLSATGMNLFNFYEVADGPEN